MLTLASQKWHWHVKMLMHVLFYITDFRGRCVLYFPEHNVLLSRRFRWVWRSMFSRHLQSQIIHHKLLLSFWDFTITCVAVQGGFDFDGLCWVVPADSQITQTPLLWCSRYSRVHHHRLLCSSTRKETCVCVCVCVCVCAGCLEMWGRIFHLLTSLFHLVSGFTQKTSVEPSSSSEAIVSRPPFTRSSVNLSVCVCCLWCWGLCIGN